MRKRKFSRKSFGGSEKSRTFASAFRDNPLMSVEKESSLKDLHRQK